MRYTQAFDILTIPTGLLRYAQPGQYVYAGKRTNRGRFWGVSRGGIVYVAWEGNVKNHADKRGYHRMMRQSAKSAS